MTVAPNDREPVAWAWPAVFGLLLLVVVAGAAYAGVWSWTRYTA